MAVACRAEEMLQRPVQMAAGDFTEVTVAAEGTPPLKRGALVRVSRSHRDDVARQPVLLRIEMFPHSLLLRAPPDLQPLE